MFLRCCTSCTNVTISHNVNLKWVHLIFFLFLPNFKNKLNMLVNTVVIVISYLCLFYINRLQDETDWWKPFKELSQKTIWLLQVQLRVRSHAFCMHVSSVFFNSHSPLVLAFMRRCRDFFLNSFFFCSTCTPAVSPISMASWFI